MQLHRIKTRRLTKHCYFLPFPYSLGGDFKEFESAAMWEDAKIGLKHLTSWERVAVVTDVDWIRAAIKVFGFLLHGHIRIFSNNESIEARTWISERIQGKETMTETL